MRARAAVAAALLLAAAALPAPGCATKAGWSMDTQAPALSLAGANGSSVPLADPGGRVSVVTFGYTSCPDVCPTTLADWRRLRKHLGADADRVRFLFVSVDYRSDTPEVADAFAKRFDPSFTGALLDSARADAVLGPFKAAAAYDSTTGGVSHTDYVYLVDGHGRVAIAYPFKTKPDAIARDLKVMLAAARARGEARS